VPFFRSTGAIQALDCKDSCPLRRRSRQYSPGASHHRKLLRLMRIMPLNTHRSSTFGLPWLLGKNGHSRSICGDLRLPEPRLLYPHSPSPDPKLNWRIPIRRGPKNAQQVSYVAPTDAALHLQKSQVVSVSCQKPVRDGRPLGYPSAKASFAGVPDLRSASSAWTSHRRLN
jgi:hypothetical protein